MNNLISIDVEGDIFKLTIEAYHEELDIYVLVVVAEASVGHSFRNLFKLSKNFL